MLKKNPFFSASWKTITWGHPLVIAPYNESVGLSFDSCLSYLFQKKMSVVREASVEDCPAILALIKELAAFEEMPDQVEMTVERLERDGFSADDQRKFSCLVAVSEDGVIVGYALFYPTYSTWVGPMMFMEDLYVTPLMRRNGIGSKLWRAVADVALRQDCQRLQWTCLGWNENAIRMYEKFGGENLTKKESWNFFRMNRDKMEAFVVGAE